MKTMIRKMTFTFVVACVWIGCFGVPFVSGDEKPPEKMDNAAVVELHKLGLGDGVIIEKIKASKPAFDTSIEGLKQLKAAGVSDPVIQAMITASKPATPVATEGPRKLSPAELNDPKVVHPPGIWLYNETDGKPTMAKLEPSVFGETKSGGGFGMAYGATAKTRAVINGAHSATQISSARPTFYFYFEVTESGLSQTTTAATSPNAFTLVEMEVKSDSKRNERRLVIGKFNAYGGGRSGPEEQSIRQFDFENLGDGIYKVTPKADLKPGEYGFMYTGAVPMTGFGIAPVGGTGGKLFDFGIAGAPAKAK